MSYRHNSLVVICFCIFTILLPWQPAKLCGLHSFHVFGRGTINKYFYKRFVKISAVDITIKANFRFSQFRVKGNFKGIRKVRQKVVPLHNDFVTLLCNNQCHMGYSIL